MFEELKRKKEKYKELEKELSEPAVLSDRDVYAKKAKEYASLKILIEEYDKYLGLEKEKASLEHVIEEEGEDSEYALLARKELGEVEEALKEKVRELEELILDEESADLRKNVIMEIRAGTGGLEAGLFAADLYKMYTKYAADKGWKTSVISLSESELGGIKEVIFAVEGLNVFKFLRFEMGTHRVQRVPETESGGRIHTSAVTVAVLPEAEDIEVEVSPQDLKIDTYRASGAGGQHVNVTDSAIRITHMPTGMVVTCQDERSQHKNRAKAMRVLKARLLEYKEAQQRKEISAQRKKQVGSGDRSEKIRTYNFPENRVTDHRIKFSVYNLPDVLEGDLGEIISKLTEEDRKLKLQGA